MIGVLKFLGRAALVAFVIAAAWKALGPLGAAGALAIVVASAVAGYRGRPSAVVRKEAIEPNERPRPAPPRAGDP